MHAASDLIEYYLKKKIKKRIELASKRKRLTARLSSATSQYFQLHSTTRSRRNFSGYVPSAPSPSTLPRLPWIKNKSPTRPGWIRNKHANSKRGMCFPKKSKCFFQASDEASPSPQVQPDAFSDSSSAFFPLDSDKDRAKSSFPQQYENTPLNKTSKSHGFLPLRLSINQTRACQSAEWMMILCALPLVSTPNDNTTQMHKNEALSRFFDHSRLLSWFFMQ